VLAASFVVVIAGLRTAAPLLNPMLLALFLATISLAPLRAMLTRGVPEVLGVGVLMVVVFLLLTLLVAVLTSSLAAFRDDLPSYQARVAELQQHGIDWLEGHGIDVPEVGERSVRQGLDLGRVMDFVGSALGQLTGVLGNFALILLLVVFLLLEVHALPRKLDAIGGAGKGRERLERIVDNVNRYVGIKSFVSGLTGLLSGLLCAAAGVNYPALWGLLAFLLNFIPNVGSVIAAIPPIALALVQEDLGLGPAAVVLVGYVALNFGIGNFLEPRMMGRSLDLSALVVFLSMVFWGWVLGAVGMFLSVPLTMVLKITLESSATTRPIAVLLGGEPRGGAPPA